MIPYGRHYLDEADVAAVISLLKEGPLTQGPMVGRFEEAVAAYVGARYAVAVSSGTAGLHLACLAAGLAENDLLVTSPMTFVASANCARYMGARVRFADIDPVSLNLSVEALRKVAMTDRPKVVMAVHYAGLPCDMAGISSVAMAHGAIVIEDAAHALGAVYPSGRRVGCCDQSLMTVFSFHPVKAIAAGEGGMITTNDEGVYHRLLRLRSHGINKMDDPLLGPECVAGNVPPGPWYYEMQELGFNYRITDIQSALGLSQFAKLDRFIAQRRALARRYDSRLAGMTQLEPVQQAGRESSAHHLYPVRIAFERAGISRGEFMQRLREQGIGSQVHYIPVHYHPYYRSLGFRPGMFPAAEAYYQEALSIPLYYRLSNDEQDQVVDTLQGLFR